MYKKLSNQISYLLKSLKNIRIDKLLSLIKILLRNSIILGRLILKMIFAHLILDLIFKKEFKIIFLRFFYKNQSI